MKKARLKYGLNMAGTFFPKGTILDVLDPKDEQVQKVWPGVQTKVGSHAIAVQFPHLNFPTFVHANELEFI
jgi:hypothetical protein